MAERDRLLGSSTKSEANSKSASASDLYGTSTPSCSQSISMASEPTETDNDHIDQQRRLLQQEPPIVLEDEENKGQKRPVVLFTTPEEVQKPKLTACLLWSAFVCVVGGSFQFGFNTGVVNTPDTVVRNYLSDSQYYMFNNTMSESQNTLVWSVTVSIFSIGGMIGGLSSAWFADHCGRRGGMMINNIFAIVAGLLMAISKYLNVYFLLVLGRLMIGFNSGLNSSLAPMYLTEIAPRQFSGKFGSAHQLMVTMSILLSQILGLSFIMGNQHYWSLLFGLPILPAVFQLCTFWFCPETPIYTVVFRGNAIQAKKDLQRLRGRENVLVELKSLQVAGDRMQNVREVSYSDMFTEPMLRWPLIIAVMMMFSQQFSGINVAIYYSTNIFKGAGLSEQNATYATLAMGLMNVLMTVISLLVVDKYGRRPLHLGGLLGMWFSSVLLVLSLTFNNIDIDLFQQIQVIGYLCIVWVVTFVASFAMGPGSIPWFYASEIFADSARGRANSVAVMTNWLANCCVGLFFLPLKDAIGQYSMLLFTLLLSVFILFTYKYAPETKQRTLEEINEDLFDRAPCKSS